MKNKLHDITKNKKVIFAIVAIAIVVVLAIACIAIASNSKDQLSVVTVSEASLKEIIEVGELSTLEYTYNSYTPVSTIKTDKKGNETEEIRYYVSYKGNVKAGFDFEALSANCDNEAKVITITIPEIKITSVHVDETSLDYIFTKDKYNTEKAYQEAYKACENDLEIKAFENATLNSIAKENAISMMKALLAPWAENLPEGYTIEYK